MKHAQLRKLGLHAEDIYLLRDRITMRHRRSSDGKHGNVIYATTQSVSRNGILKWAGFFESSMISSCPSNSSQFLDLFRRDSSILSTLLVILAKLRAPQLV